MDDSSIDSILGVLTNAANSAIAARYQQPFELQKMKLEALANNGMLYPEGYPMSVAGGGSMLLLVGGALLAYVLLKK